MKQLLKKHNLIIILLTIVIIHFNLYAWTWSYKKEFQSEKLNELAHKMRLYFSRTDTPPFGQLIFSWNAFRPECGYFSFLVKAQYASGEESHWHKMMEWGKGVQRSFTSTRSSDGSQFVHVRYEVPQKANGFCIMVQAHEGANLSLLKMVSVSITDLSLFVSEKASGYFKFPSIVIKQVPRKSQMRLAHEHAKRMCSPTATSMMLAYLMGHDVYPVDVARRVYDKGLDAYGSWPFNAAHAFERCPTVQFRVLRLSSFESLYRYLAQGTPVVVSVRGHISTAPQSYPNGHLLLVVGWDQKTKSIIVHDPAFDQDHKVRHRYKLVDFLPAWERSHRLAYVAEYPTIDACC